MNTHPRPPMGSSVGAPCAPEATADVRPKGPRIGLLECPEPLFCGAAAERFARSSAPACESAPHMVLDLSAVRRIDSAGLRAISRLARLCRTAGGEMRLCSPTAAVRVLLVASGLHEVAAVFASRRQAELDLTAV